MKMKQIIHGRYKWMIAAMAAAFSLFTAVSAALAYFIHWRLLNNVFSIGYNDISIVEEYDPPKELKEGVNSFAKRIQVKNTGKISCYVRVLVKFSDSDIEKISELSPDGSEYYSALEYAEHLPKHWSYISEADDELLGGYYYYTEELAPDQRTDPLLEKVKTTFEKAEDVTAYEIYVYSESVQTLDADGEAFTGNEPYLDVWREFLAKPEKQDHETEGV